MAWSGRRSPRSEVSELRGRFKVSQLILMTNSTVQARGRKQVVGLAPIHAATNEEEEEFVLKGWSAGNASQPATDFQDFTETRYFPNLSFQSPMKLRSSLTAQYLLG